MKNKPINKFAFMFVIGLSLLFTCSNAAEIFKDSTTLTLQQGLGAEEVRSDFDDLGHTYNHSQLNSFFLQHASYLRNDSTYTNPEFDLIVEDLMAKASSFHNYDYDGYLFTSTGDTNYHLFLFNSDDVDIAYYENGSGKYVYFSLLEGSNFLYFRRYNASTVDYMYCENVLSGYYMNRNYTRLAIQSNLSIKLLSDVTTPTTDREFTWDGTSYYQYVEDEPEGPSLITDEEFSSVLAEITSSELFYQHIPSDYRNNFYVQYDVNSENYLFYFYPSNYQVYGLLRNENDYHVICDKDFSWWDNVVDFFKKIFIRNTENLDYKMIYVKVLDDNSCSFWYRSKSMLSMDETLFNFDLNPIVYSSVQIPFYGQHGGGGVDIDTGDVTLATEPEYVVNEKVYGETNIVYNPTPIEKVKNEQDFWDKVTNRLSSIVSEIKSFPEKIISAFGNLTGLTKIITLISPIGSAILIILNVLLSSISLLARAVAFVYTLPTINASDALFLVDVDSTTGLVFAGNSWGTKFLEGLNMVKEFSWNGLNLWTLFTSFIVAMFAIHCVKLVRKHYHY